MFTALVLLLVAVFTPAHVNAIGGREYANVVPGSGSVLVEDTTYPGPMGLFSSRFIGVPLDQNNRAVVNFVAGDYAIGDYVISTETRTQSERLFENTITLIFLSSGTWWVYLAQYGSTINWDFIQIRIVDKSWTGPITPKFQNPPFTWRYGYPPYGVPFTSPDDASGSDGTVATLPSPTVISIPSPHSSTSTSIWLAPLLVGIIMIAITVPIVIVAYKKGKQHSKPTQVESKEEGAMENQQQQQQIDQANQVQV